MPSVKVTSTSNLSPAECFQRITKMFENDAELKRLDPGFTCQFDDKSLKGAAAGKQFKASMLVTPTAGGAIIEINVDLPFHLALAKGLVQKTLEKKLSHALR